MYILKQTKQFSKDLKKEFSDFEIKQFEKQKEKLKYKLIGDSLYKNILWELKINIKRIYYLVNHKNEIILFTACSKKNNQQLIINRIKERFFKQK